MILKQYYLGCLAHASYLVANAGTGGAAVIDPQRHVDQCLDDADRLGLSIDHVFLARFQADFLAGHLELRDRVGARISLDARAEAEYELTPLGDGDAVELSRVRLEVLQTPGHSPESISILVYDRERDEVRPHKSATPSSLETRSSSATSAAPICAPRSAGAPRRPITSPTTRSSTPRSARPWRGCWSASCGRSRSPRRSPAPTGAPSSSTRAIRPSSPAHTWRARSTSDSAGATRPGRAPCLTASERS